MGFGSRGFEIPRAGGAAGEGTSTNLLNLIKGKGSAGDEPKMNFNFSGKGKRGKLVKSTPKVNADFFLEGEGGMITDGVKGMGLFWDKGRGK